MIIITHDHPYQIIIYLHQRPFIPPYHNPFIYFPSVYPAILLYTSSLHLQNKLKFNHKIPCNEPKKITVIRRKSNEKKELCEMIF